MATSQLPAIRALLIDISGTLLIGSSPIPGAAQALAKLRAACVPFRLCSNTSKESTDAMHKRMQTSGMDVRREELWTSIGALRSLLTAMGVKRPYMLLSHSALEECTDRLREEVQHDPGMSRPHDAVVVGFAPSLLDYAHLNTAFRILIGEDQPQPRDTSTSQTHALNATPSHSSDIHIQTQTGPCSRAPLIALHKVRYLEATDGALSLGPGPFVRALEDAARTSAIVVGKPTRAFFEAVLRDLDHDLGPGPGARGPRVPDLLPLSPPRGWEGIAVIGDDVHTDLGDGAVELGLWRVLVKTGKYRPGDEEQTDGLPPDQVCASFAEFVGALLEHRQMSSSII